MGNQQLFCFAAIRNAYFRNEMKRTITVILFAAGLITGCREDDSTSWDTRLLSPLAEAELSVEDIIPDSLIISAIGEPILIRYENTLSLIPYDSVLQIPDTSIIQNFIFPVPFNLPAGFEVLNLNELVRFNYGGIELTEARVASGSLDYRVISTLSDTVFYTYRVPKAQFSAVPLNLQNIAVPPGSVANPSIQEKSINLAGYRLDLRGNSLNESNQLQLELDAQLNPNGNGCPVLGGQEIVRFTSTFKNIVPAYARGYFGQQDYISGLQREGLGFMKNLSGNLNLDDITLDLELVNGIGADFAFNINELKGRKSTTGAEVTLNHAIIGNEQRIARAAEVPQGGLPYTPTRKSYSLTTSNSNLKAFIEALPDELYYAIDAKVNPLGNISSGNDFIYNSSNANIKLKLEMPLRFSANALVFRDTIAFDGVEDATESPVQEASLRLFAENGFPYELSTTLWLLDVNKVKMDSLFGGQTIAAAPVDADLKVTQPRKSVLSTTLSPAKLEKLEKTRYIILESRLNTVPENTLLPVYTHYKLKLQLSGRGVYRINIQ